MISGKILEPKYQPTKQEWAEFVQEYERWVEETQQNDFLDNQKS